MENDDFTDIINQISDNLIDQTDYGIYDLKKLSCSIILQAVTDVTTSTLFNKRYQCELRGSLNFLNIKNKTFITYCNYAGISPNKVIKYISSNTVYNKIINDNFYSK